MPNHEVLQACRRKNFKDKITTQLEHHDLELYRELLEDMFTADQSQEDIAAAMMMLLQGKQKLILPPDPIVDKKVRRDRGERGDRREIHARLNVVANVRIRKSTTNGFYIVLKWVVLMV